MIQKQLFLVFSVMSLIVSGCGTSSEVVISNTPPAQVATQAANTLSTPSQTPQKSINTEQVARPTSFGGGSRIAFSSNRDGNYEIYIMNSDGTEQVRLTNSPADDWFPQLTHDGQLLLYWSFSEGNPQLVRLSWMRADGSEQGIFADWVGPNSDISSEGLAVFESYSKEGKRDIVRMAAEGGELVQLTNHKKDDVHPNWSPDGETIAFASYRDGTPHIYLMNWDGTNQHRLTKSDMVELEPDWSPDGSKIAFFSGDDTQTNIFIINYDGTNLRQLTDAVDNYNENPVWSPDGTMIAFWSNRTGDKEIYSISLDGSVLVNLTNNPGEDENPTWSK